MGKVKSYSNFKSDLISDMVIFKIEFVPKDGIFGIKFPFTGNVDVLHSAIVESSGHITSSSSHTYYIEPIPVHEGQYWNQFFYEEYERYNSDAGFIDLIFNIGMIFIHLCILQDQNGLTGSYANLTQNEVKFNDVNIPALTILNPDGTTYQVSNDKFNRDYMIMIWKFLGLTEMILSILLALIKI